MSDFVKYEQESGIVTLTLNDAAHRNPLGDTVRARLIELMKQAFADDEIRAIVLTGAGGHFSAGADVRQMQSDDGPNPARSRRRLAVLQDLLRLIVAGPKPVVAAVEGVAFGAGLSIVSACDWVVAAESAKMGAAFGRIGLAPDCGLLWSLPQRIGMSPTRDLIFTGRAITGAEAHALGLVDELAQDQTPLERARTKAESYLSTAPLTIAATKTAIAELPGNLEAALAIEAHQQPMMSMTADHAEARAAFMAKRPPHFRGR